MKLYFLVEGETEMDIYPKWVSLLRPDLPLYQNYNDFCEADNGVFFISGYGYPSIYNHLENSIADINSSGDVNYFYVIIDSDEESVEDRENEVKEKLSQHELLNCEAVSIIQNRCFETMLLGNRQTISRQPNTKPLIDYMRYYNVVNDDPELMGNYSERFTHSQFHAKFLSEALLEKRIRYTKGNASAIATKEYMETVLSRIDTTGHLNSFKKLFDHLREIS